MRLKATDKENTAEKAIKETDKEKGQNKAKKLKTNKYFQKKYKTLTFRKGTRIRHSPQPCPKIQAKNFLPFFWSLKYFDYLCRQKSK
jgi:hypothetical protein